MLHGKELIGADRAEGLRGRSLRLGKGFWRETCKAGGPACVLLQREAQRRQPGAGGRSGAWGLWEMWLVGLDGGPCRQPWGVLGKECVWALWARSCPRPLAWQKRTVMKTSPGSLCESASAAAVRSTGLGGLNNQNLFSHSLGGQKSKSRCPGMGCFGGFSPWLERLSSPVFSRGIQNTCPSPVPPSYKDNATLD